jgi:hypothetical protein
MVERSRIRLLAGAAASLLLPGLSGCGETPCKGPPPSYRPYYAYPPYYYPSYYYPFYYYDYYYYPYWRVYFHIYSGWYYYHDHDHWRRARRLPPHIHLDKRHRRLLRIRDRKPWLRHDEHRRKYPPPPEPTARPRPEPAPPRPREEPAPPRPREEPAPRRRRTEPEPPRPRAETAPQRPRAAPEPRRAAPGTSDFLRRRDREEREHNLRRHEEYRIKPWRRED